MSPRSRGRRGLWGTLLLLAAGVVVGGFLMRTVLAPDPVREVPPVDTGLTIEVLNGCGEAGAADQAADILRRAGFQVVRTANADHFHYRTDLVVARGVTRERALPVGQWLEAQVVEQRRPESAVDVTVIVGKPPAIVPQ